MYLTICIPQLLCLVSATAHQETAISYQTDFMQSSLTCRVVPQNTQDDYRSSLPIWRPQTLLTASTPLPPSSSSLLPHCLSALANGLFFGGLLRGGGRLRVLSVPSSILNLIPIPSGCCLAELDPGDAGRGFRLYDSFRLCRSLEGVTERSSGRYCRGKRFDWPVGNPS